MVCDHEKGQTKNPQTWGMSVKPTLSSEVCQLHGL